MKIFTRADVISWRPCCGESETLCIMKGLPSEMTALDVLRHEAAIPQDRMWCVLRSEVLSDRTLRLFAAWCARTALDAERAAGREPDPRSWHAVDVAERHAVGQATEDEMCSAHDAAYAAAYAAAAAADAAVQATITAVRDVRSVVDPADAADAARTAGVSAAYSAAYSAARTAGVSAAYAAAAYAARTAGVSAYAARAAAYSAAYSAARAAAYAAAYAAAAYAARTAQVEQLMRLIGENENDR